MDLTRPATWINLTIAILVIGFVLHQLAARVPQSSGIVKASFGA